MRIRIAISLLASLAIHALPLLVRGVLEHVRWPAPPISIEVRTVRRAPPAPRPSPPPLPAKPSTPGSGSGKPRRASAAPAKPAPPLPPTPPPVPPATADLSALSPGDARLVLLLRADRLRTSRHRAGVEAVLQALPDYHTLLDGTGLSALDDLDALLIATANPQDVTATFLAARHRADPRLPQALARRTIPAWDRRVMHFVSPTLSTLSPPDAPPPRRGDGGVVGSPDGGVADPQAEWLAELARFDQLADEPGAPALLLTASDLGALVRLQNGLPTPLAAALAATADPAPLVRIKLVFAGPDDAHRFEVEWPNIVARYRDATLLFGISSLLDGLVLKRGGVEIEIAGVVAAGQIALALSWAKALLPRNRAAYVDEPAAPDAGAAPPTDLATPSRPATAPVDLAPSLPPALLHAAPADLATPGIFDLARTRAPDLARSLRVPKRAPVDSGY